MSGKLSSLVKRRMLSFYLISNLIALGFAGMFVFVDVDVEGVTITVDINGSGEYTSIQSAIDAANPGDTIQVLPGTYHEDVNIGKQLRLIGNGPDDTIIDGDDVTVYIGANDVTVEGFNIINTYNYSGIEINISFNNARISNTNCSGLEIGISIFGADNCIIANNTFTNSDLGIHVHSSDANIIENNLCDRNDDGIKLYNAHHNHIRENLIKDNHNFGAYIDFSTSTTIEKNLFEDNLVSILVWNLTLHNYIFHNVFTTYYSNGWYEGSVFWNNSQQEGNFWSDYYGLDNGEDGRVPDDAIGDTNLPHLGRDYYPFMYPWAWKLPQTPVIIDPTEGYINREGEFKITWTQCYNADGYELAVSRNESFNTSTIIYPSSKSSHNLNGLDDGFQYFRVRSKWGMETSDWSDPLEVRIDLIPIMPWNFKAEAYPEGNAINLSWDPNLKNTVLYQIAYKVNDDFQKLATVQHPNCTYDHVLLTDGLEYVYKIRSIDLTSERSVYTNPITATPIDVVPPYPPDQPNISLISHNTIALEWNISSDGDVAGHSIYRSEISDPLSWGSDWGEPIYENLPVSWSGYIDTNVEELTRYYYVITALDEVPNESGFSEEVSAMTILGPHSPEINNSVPDFDILEDTVDNTTINLYHWFKDINQDKLEFKCYGWENLNVDINQENGEVEITPDEDWSGAEFLNFNASDGSSSINASVWVNVIPVNDAPGNVQIIEPNNNTEIYEGNALTFIGNANDVDTPFGDELKFTWLSNISGILGIREKMEDFILKPGYHMITFAVNDKGFAYTNFSIDIVVLPKNGTAPIFEYSDDDPMQDETEDENVDSEPAESSSSWAFYGVVFFVMVLGILLFVMKWRTIFDVKKSTSEKVQPPPPAIQKLTPPKPRTSAKPVDRDTMLQNTTESQVDEAKRQKHSQEQPEIRPEKAEESKDFKQ